MSLHYYEAPPLLVKFVLSLIPCLGIWIGLSLSFCMAGRVLFPVLPSFTSHNAKFWIVISQCPFLLFLSTCCPLPFLDSNSLCMHAQSRPTLCNSWTITHQSPLPWNFPGKNTGVDCHFILQGILPIQGLNPHFLGLLHQFVRFFTT